MQTATQNPNYQKHLVAPQFASRLATVTPLTWRRWHIGLIEALAWRKYLPLNWLRSGSIFSLVAQQLPSNLPPGERRQSTETRRMSKRLIGLLLFLFAFGCA